MSSSPTFCPEGQNFIIEAVQKDNQQKLQEALSLYKQAFLKFQLVLNTMTSPNIKREVENWLIPYIDRATTIQKMLKEEKKKQSTNSSIHTNGTTSSSLINQRSRSKDTNSDENKIDSTESESDNEILKMQRSLVESLAGSLLNKKVNVHWNDIKGLKNAKEALQETITDPINYPDYYKRNNVKPIKGILLYGPAGTGKSFLAKAVATECECSFLNVTVSQLQSKYQGESERLVQALFTLAKEKQPCVIFIDEIDSILTNRMESSSTDSTSNKIKAEFLTLWDGLASDEDRILILGASNIPWGIDPAFLRRLPKRIYISLPDKEARFEMIQAHLKKIEHQVNENQMQDLADLLEGYSGSDIDNLFKEVGPLPLRMAKKTQYFEKIDITENDKTVIYYKPLQEYQDHAIESNPSVVHTTLVELKNQNILYHKVSYLDIMMLLKHVKPINTVEHLTRYIEWTRDLGQQG